MNNEKIDELKVILIGETGVGKTNLINVTMGYNFNEYEQPSYSNAFLDKIFEINNKKYKLHIWDTIGQEKFRQLTKLFFKESNIVILVYDKSNQLSFQQVPFWYDEVKNVLGDQPILAVVGNKSDLDDTIDDVDENEARKYAEKINAKFRLASAKENPKGFEQFLKELVIEYIKKIGGIIVENDDRIKLNNINNGNNKKEKKSFFKC